MFRVETRDSADTLIVRLEGRFTGDDAEYTRTLTTRFAARVKLLVDLTEVVFVDAVGEDVLFFLGRLGAEFIAPNSYSLDICERLKLPVTPNRAAHMKELQPHTNRDQAPSNSYKPRKK